MLRRIIHIDQALCNGCGLCVSACHEGAIGLVNGKAQLLRDDYCDGLGDCLPACPTGAITFVEREAAAYDEAAVKANQQKRGAHAGGCPGSRASVRETEAPAAGSSPSQLRQWPVQLRLAPVAAPWLDGADVLIAADCAAYAHGSFHQDFMQGRVTLIGCPKLDDADYAAKLRDMLLLHDVRSVTVCRMTVPCCGGLERAVRSAVALCGKRIPLRVVTIDTDGSVVSETE